ncbi:hypothetical protein MTR_5g016720 [Medicago truncatula]|uniref:Uncharacterized protein n=1 Tax=Medicago truncatula TaxID=3880 RepID=G7K5A7_MEDTR|nr:hypothetical protein MTR_5g016720 [Medicago truncatula]
MSSKHASSQRLRCDILALRSNIIVLLLRRGSPNRFTKWVRCDHVMIIRGKWIFRRVEMITLDDEEITMKLVKLSKRPKILNTKSSRWRNALRELKR